MALEIDYSSGIFEAAPSGETVGTVTGNATLDLTSGNLFNHTPTANTTFVFSNPPTTGSAYDMTLKVVGANVVTGYDVANGTYDNKSGDANLTASFVSGFYIRPDTGTTLYVADISNDQIRQGTLNTAWDISSGTNTGAQTLDTSSQATQPEDCFVSSDGSKIYVSCANTNAIYQYNMSTAYSISTATYANKSMSTGSIAPKGIYFRYDGLMVYFVGNQRIYQYSLSTAWDISTASNTNNNALAQESQVRGLWFKDDGTKVYTVGTSGDKVIQQSLSTAWDISTVSNDNVSFSTTAPTPTGLQFKPDGSKAYVGDYNYSSIYQYSTAGAAAAATFTYPSSVKWAGGAAPSAPANGEKDVYNFFTFDGGTTYYGFQAGDAMA